MMEITETIEKGWGNEFIWANTDKYCGKLLNFKKESMSSMHFHAIKDETWLVLSGKFIVKWIRTKDAEIFEQELNVNDTWRNEPFEPHQLICIEEGTILEVSTKDIKEDNYRVLKGDSQNDSCDGV